MRRRDLLPLVAGAALASPIAGQAQQSRIPLVGVLFAGSADTESYSWELRDRLRELGYVEGRSIRFEFRSAHEDLGRLPGLAAELVRLNVDVIVAFYTPSVLAAQQSTRAIPIVMIAGDPLAVAIVDSLSRPGGNVTGLSMMAAESSGKCVEMLRDMLPAVRRVAALVNATDPAFAKSFFEQIELAGRITRIEIQRVMVGGPNDLDAAFSAMLNDRPDAAVVQPSLPTRRVAALALRHRLPTASVPRSFAVAGGLVSFGAAERPLFRRSADYVHRVLLGNRPAEMPVEQPTKFELTVNLKTAKEIGLTIPELFLQRADEVIE